jgi:hypothetical protein
MEVSMSRLRTAVFCGVMGCSPGSGKSDGEAGGADGADGGGADTSCSESTWYTDADGDGFGDPGASVDACAQPSGAVADHSDCDDGDADIHPGAAEDDCTDPVDRNCDGSVGYADEDDDGYAACEDCDDADPEVSPGATEICNDLDDDCDDAVDEDLDQTWYTDGDGDGFGDPDSSVEDCAPPDGTVADNTDCDDTNADARPDHGTDWCDAVDNDCDGMVDEDVETGWILLSVDSESGRVLEIDPATGATTVLSTLSASVSGSINSMDVRANDELSIVHDSSGRLHTLDACTGQLTSIGATGAGDMGGISFAGGGSLYGISQASDEFMSLSTTTGAASVVGALGFDLSACGIAYDCSTDTLYGADNSGQIFQVDTTTGLLHSFVSIDVPFRGVGLEFDHTTGDLLASTGSGNALYRVNPVTGASTRVGAIGATNANDLAFHPACP